MAYSQADVDLYYRLTNIPPEKAMLSVIVEGDKVNLSFMPKVQSPRTDSSKPKGFGK